MYVETDVIEGTDCIKDYTLAKEGKHSSFWDSDSDDEKNNKDNERKYKQMLSFIR